MKLNTCEVWLKYSKSKPKQRHTYLFIRVQAFVVIAIQGKSKEKKLLNAFEFDWKEFVILN